MRIREWFLASRPWSFPMTIISASLGAVLAAQEGFFDPILYLLTLSGLILFHASTNLLNDYYDIKHGVDKPESPTALYRKHPILTGEFTLGSFKKAVTLLYVLVLLVAGYLTLLRGWIIMALTLAGLILSIFYTSDPLKFKHYPLGEVAVFTVWGPLMVAGTHYVLSGVLSVRAVLASLPLGVLVAAVLFANNLRDMRYDCEVGLRTLAVLVGLERGLRLYKCFIASAYILSTLLVLLRVLSPWSLLVLLTVPKAASIVKLFEKRVPAAADPITAQLTLIFGVLLILGEGMRILLPL